MHFEVNRKVFSTALEKCLDAVEAADVNKRENCVRISCADNAVVISTTFARAEVSAEVKQPGAVVVEASALSRVAKTSGPMLSLASDGASARFACGKLKGTVPRVAGTFAGFIEPEAHLELVLPSVKRALAAVTLKDASRERSLHLAPRHGLVRIEAGDDYRGAFCVVSVDKKDANTETITVPAKSLDILPKVFPTQCTLRLSDSVLIAQDDKTAISVPLTARQPIDIYGQLETFLQDAEQIGSFETAVDAFATSIADVVQTTGSDQNQVDLLLKDGCLLAEVQCSSSGGLSSEFDLKSCSMPKGDAALSLSSAYLKTGLGLFSGDIRLRIYPSFVIIELVEVEAPIQLQQLALPVISVSSIQAEKPAPQVEAVSEPKKTRSTKERKKRDSQ